MEIHSDCPFLPSFNLLGLHDGKCQNSRRYKDIDEKLKVGQERWEPTLSDKLAQLISRKAIQKQN